MRLSLRTKVTLALVAFGLIPAGIVAAFAYAPPRSSSRSRTLIIRHAAAAIADHIVYIMYKNSEPILKAEKLPEGGGAHHYPALAAEPAPAGDDP